MMPNFPDPEINSILIEEFEKWKSLGLLLTEIVIENVDLVIEHPSRRWTFIFEQKAHKLELLLLYPEMYPDAYVSSGSKWFGFEGYLKFKNAINEVEEPFRKICEKVPNYTKKDYIKTYLDVLYHHMTHDPDLLETIRGNMWLEVPFDWMGLK